MDTMTQTDGITAEEFRNEWRRLRERRLPFDAPEVTALIERLGRRNDVLFERFGRRLVDANQDKWVAISTEGETLIRDTSWEARRDAEARFEAGGFAVRKLNHDFQGIEIRH
jgi:hypothetical protein